MNRRQKKKLKRRFNIREFTEYKSITRIHLKMMKMINDPGTRFEFQPATVSPIEIMFKSEEIISIIDTIKTIYPNKPLNVIYHLQDKEDK